MTSKLTRERLQEIAEDGFLKHGESKELARMALAAMDSEPVALQPELAKVIYHFRDCNEGFPVERFKADYVISWMLANYPPAQPAPVVPQDVLEALQKVARIRLDMNDFDGDRRGIADCLGDAEEALIEVVNRRAAMLQAEPVCTCPSGNGSLRWPCPVHAGSSPVIPDGYGLVPMRLTAENGAKGALSGEFSETKFLNCPECFGDDECETCDGSGKIEITVPVTWTTIKAIWVKGVEHFAFTAQEND